MLVNEQICNSIMEHEKREENYCFIIPLLKNKVMRLSVQDMSPECLVTVIHKSKEIAPLEHEHRTLWGQLQK